MSKPAKKSLKHKLNDALATTSAAKRLRVSCNVPATSSSQDDSGISLSTSSKKKTPVRRKTKHLEAATVKRCLNPPAMDVSDMNVTQLLAVGEGTGIKPLSADSTIASDSSDSDGGDWEEVNDSSVLKEPVIPKEGVNITLDAPVISFKRKKKEQDVQDEIRRQLKRRQKEIQELMHKVHLLCWIAHIKFVNSVLNSETLLAMSISLTTSKNLYPPKRADCDYLERVVNWFAKTIVVADEVKRSDRSPGLLRELTIQFETKTAFTKKDLVYMFVVFLRSLGVQTRLISSIVAVPLKPSGAQTVSSLNKKIKVFSQKDIEIKTEDKAGCSKTSSNNKSNLPDNVTKNKALKEETLSRNLVKVVSQKTKKALPRKEEKNEPSSSREIQASKGQDIETRKLRNRKPVKTSNENTGKDEKPGKTKTGRTVKKLVESLDNDEEEFSKYFKETPKRGVKNAPAKNKKTVIDVKPSTSKEVSPSTSRAVQKEDSDDDFSPCRKQVVAPKKKIDRRVLSSDEEHVSPENKRRGLDNWVEVFLEAEEKWITVDIVKKKIHCTRQLCARATQPVVYILACNNDSTLKDVTKRYVPNWHSDTRKRRVAESWWQETLWPYLPPVTAQEREEDEDIAKQLQDMPLPSSIAEYKFHPLYALKRHLLKFEGIYPPDAPPIGYIRKEPVYARECVVTLRSRDIWYKEARVVRLNETPYKIVKSRPKYDKMTGDWRKDLPLEVFGIWQTEEFIPPIAVDGKVPRNEYGNVDLFKSCMLPIGTVHIQVPALNRVAKKLGIDCAPAIVGFEFHSGGSHPVQDGFVVCEEFKDQVLDAWNKEIDESAKRSEEKREKRVYGNWRRLIRGLFIREKLKTKYAFNEKPEDEASTSTQYLKVQKGEKDSD